MSHAAPPAPILRVRLRALYHDELLRAAVLVGKFAQSGSVPKIVGAGSAALSFRRDRICGDAGACASVDWGAGAGQSLRGHASCEAGLRAPAAAPIADEERRAAV